jgi:penicillin-binding protein 2
VVATHAPLRVVLDIEEHREQFPGVAVETVTLPSYPHGSLAAHLLG